jgi:diguanylate cyclase (GGDEF)-like protein
MMLVQQSGPGSLAVSHLRPDLFLDFIRKVEALVLKTGQSPIFTFWSSRSARRLLQEGPGYRQLMTDAFCVSIFSEDRVDKHDEFCFMVESKSLCLVLYGREMDDSGVTAAEAGEASRGTFQCVGSCDPLTVRRAYQLMFPLWQFVDLPEANNLEDARANAAAANSAAQFVQEARQAWPVIKAGAEATKATATATQGPPPATAAPRTNGNGDGDGQDAARYIDLTQMAAEDGPIIPPGTAPEVVADTPGPGPTKDKQDKSKRTRDNKGLKDLRQVWTNISDEERIVFPPDAQKIIRDIVGQLRHSSDLSSILQLAIEQLTEACHADRGLIWQVVGDQLTVTNEHAPNGQSCFSGTNLGSQESTAIVLDFLSRFPDEGGTGVIGNPDTGQDHKLHKMSPTLASLVELGGVKARLVAQLRCRGIFSGFLELQQCTSTRDWSEEDAAILQSVAEVLSFVVQQAFDLSKIEQDADEMKLINEISSLFRESKGQRSQDTLAKSVMLVAEHMGFTHSQIYLFIEEEGNLQSQMADSSQSDTVDLSAKDNPFVQVFESGRGKVVNAEYTRKGDPFFGHDTALIVPLLSEGERLGVLGLCERSPGTPPFRAQDRELALTIAGNLASIIRADQAIAQIRADRAREQLINRVSQEIRQSIKELDQIFETLVHALTDHLKLDLCVVSLFDQNENSFVNSKITGELTTAEEPLTAHFAEQLFEAVMELLQKGQIIILYPDDIRETLAPLEIIPPGMIKMITLVPLVQGESFKGALCMVSCERARPFAVKDMKMIQDLADRVAVVVTHKELFEQVERQAVTDPMTGLYNRRYFQEQLIRELDRNQRFGHPFSYIILDLDFLKKINDTLGHQFGDAAIKHISNVLRKSIRDVDTTARYGGEEFVVLLPETDVAGARIVADRMCASIREKEVEGIGIVTASVGVATYPVDAQDAAHLTELADQALYLAKHRGRNQVCSVSEDLLPTLDESGEKSVAESKRDAPIKPKTEELAFIDLKLIAEHGLLGILGAVVKMIEARDMYTNDRSPRAADYATRIAQSLHLSKDHATIISLAAILHNVGKIAVDEEILQKKGPLTDEERKIIQTAPTIGAKILEPAKHLFKVASVVEAYHEHWDGTGYPKGLKGEEIPLEARIVALADAYVAMTSDRPYRKALSKEESVKLIADGANTEWDPRLVKIFLNLLSREEADGGATAVSG